MSRLPSPGSDDGVWGTVLNDFLSVAHNPDGTLQDTGILAAKATDSAVVHNTGNESIAGTKTFTTSPVVPTPTLGSQAANKTYVDSVAAGSDGGFRGAWSSSTAYNAGDIVTLASASYGALSSNTNHMPNVSTPFLSGTPGTSDSGDAGTYEMGITFTVSKTVRLTAINFYKTGSANGGTHVGHLWDATTVGSEVILSSATFTDETLSGVQSVPLIYTLQPGVTYAISVSLPNGHYSVDNNYYTAPITVGSVTVPANGSHFSNSLGVYPNQGAGTTNYWVFMTWDEADGNWSVIGRF